MRILVVEDEPELNRLLTKRLKSAGYSVDSCVDGRDALDHLPGAEYDALVLILCCRVSAAWRFCDGCAALPTPPRCCC